MSTESHAPTSAPSAVRVQKLTVAFPGASGMSQVVDGVSFEVAPGECLALVGESGSGKSVTARSLLGLAGSRAEVHADELSLGGESMLGASDAAWRRHRGRSVGLVLQDALVSLDPLRTVGREVADPLRLHTRLSPAERATRVAELLAQVGLPDPERIAAARAGELSGGQRQRALIASAIALDPPLLIADEPTTALDVTVQAQILELLADIRAAGTAILLISHDLAVVSRIADRVAVFHDGRIVEIGPTADVLGSPQHPQTQRMLQAVPIDKPRGTRLAVTVDAAATRPRPLQDPQPSASAASGAAESVEPDIVLEAIGLTKSFRLPDGRRHLAVDGVSFQLQRGQTLGLVGESGSGKTTTARLALALGTPDAGEVRVLGQAWTATSEKNRRGIRPQIGAIYQDALGSFDPRWTVGQLLADATSRRTSTAPPTTPPTPAELLDWVSLPQSLLGRRPLDLSGGQRQRVGIARTLASRPQILICDEPVSALDVGVQAHVLDLLDELQREFQLSLLFISHDLGVIQHVSDRVAVMQGGRIVEIGDSSRVLDRPENPYTRSLLDAVPRIA